MTKFSVLKINEINGNAQSCLQCMSQGFKKVMLIFYYFARKKFALPEDVEYFNIQLQMNYDLFDEYKEVERIICMYKINVIAVFLF